MLPIVAIVGRANVGKSRLFNRLVGWGRAIVADTPGITRDRHYAMADWAGHNFIVVDTGGCEFDPSADIEKRITDQSLKAIAEADVVVVIFDGQLPPTDTDAALVKRLRRLPKPIVAAVNKVDRVSHEGMLADYYRLGLQQLFPISAEHGRGVDDLLDEVVKHFPAAPAQTKREKNKLRIAVIGRPNVGKSTLINQLVGEERVVAHELPGTTRDAIDVEVTFQGRHYVFVDTAGIKRRARTEGSVEKRTAIKSLRTIERADFACLLIDGPEGLTHHDLELASFAFEQGKGLLFLVNKWDAVPTPWENYCETIQYKLKELADVPLERISAKTGFQCLTIFPLIDQLERAMTKRLTAEELDTVLEDALARHHLPVSYGREVVIRGGEQTGVRPPTFVLFANAPAAVPFAYRRYLMHCLGQALGIAGVPIKVIFKSVRARRRKS